MSGDGYWVGMGQILVEGGRPESNLDRAANAIRDAAAQGCRLVVLPECLDFGWTDPSARNGAQPIPGSHVAQLAATAKANSIYVAAGLVERAGERLYNAAVLLDPAGRALLHYRKINELAIGLELYSVGDRLGVVETELGVIGLNICADNFDDSAANGHMLARMGAQLIVSPSSWAVPADRVGAPYGDLWRDAYGRLASLYDVTVIGVSNVGPITAGPWQGRACIGSSLAVGPGGRVSAVGPHGIDAAALLKVFVQPAPPIARGADMGAQLRERGYREL
jgi:predicted amidohydrolase